MSLLRLLFGLCALLAFVPFALAQAPVVDGEDQEFLAPVAPAETLPSPSPNRSAAPSVQPERRPFPGVESPPPIELGPTPVPPPLTCRRQRIRSLSGQCTSAFESTWAEAQRTQLSYLRDHTSHVPTGTGLKSAREISNIISDQRTDIFNSKSISELFVFFGQFIDHNLVATPTSDIEKFDIVVPAGDPRFTGSSMSFKRSLRGFTGEGTNERPINTLSSALDLSAVYGVNDPRNSFLLQRDSRGELTGKMKVSLGDLLPFNSDGFNNAPNSASARFYLAGDHRANEHPMLTAIHTLFVREHNRLVDEIRVNFPEDRVRRLSTSTIFEWARQINIAQFQKIVYEEFLPAIFGRRFRRYRGYRQAVNPTVSDIFAGAAFRVGHTMVGNVVTRRGRFGPLPPLTLKSVFFKEFGLQETEEVDNLFRGAIGTKAQEVDLEVHDILRNMLFEFVSGEEGFDLIALNIQRGRDHALPTYNQIREIFGLPRATSFIGITGDLPSANKLSNAYEGDVDKIEAWPGLVAERKSGRAGLGETMRRVWEIEFLRLRDGDQFFYLRRRKSIARVLQMFMPNVIRPIFSKRTKIFRDIILRNTDIRASEIPLNIFKA
ncbi:Animal heme peroxidase homologue [Chondrus crispus]|uniref:Animal heme peroxidase homologue n=1 Tax=Chondrus crispus TaxID=2769 RepID=R7QQ72_CHOCR|nr:Animal heme peroxidase homologue [Chondrus crispus]CDF39510.1 Animal heme peroxidase homologue [Chondrus crispus]|eukprot:XP_005719421.1 Animal heme peroxidase homologue [Chondrus crispus]